MWEKAKELLLGSKSKKNPEELNKRFEQHKKEFDKLFQDASTTTKAMIDAHVLDSYRSFFEDMKRYGYTKTDMLSKRETHLQNSSWNDQKWKDRVRPLYDQALNEVYGWSHTTQPSQSKTTPEEDTQNSHTFAQAEIQSDGGGSHSRTDHASESPDGMIHLDLVDVEPYLDLFADQLAMSDYDDEMENIAKAGFFKRLVKRTVHRTWRGAYIQSQKEKIKREVRQELRNGTLSKSDIIDFVEQSDDSIQGGNYLDFEKSRELTIHDVATKKIITDVIGARDPATRTAKIKELKTALELQSGTLLELNQIDSTIARVEAALIWADLSKTDIGLNLFDIGRIGNERWEEELKNNVPKSGIARFLNKLDQKIGSAGPIASRISGILRHPTTAAIAATVAVTASSVTFNTLTKALTLGLIPWSLVWGVVAAHRSKREELDRQVLIARSKTTLDARKENKILTEKQNELDKLINQHSITDMYLMVINPVLTLEERQETALLYLAKRESTKRTGINWLKYDGEGNSTEQNTRMLMAINSWDLGRKNWYKASPNTEYIATVVTSLNESAQEIYKKREEFARKYGNMEWLKFAAVGYGVGLGIGGILTWVQGAYHGIMGDTNISTPLLHTPTTSNTIVAPAPIHTPGITPLSHVDRVWMDNNSHRFDGNELRLWKDSNGGFDISRMFGHTSSHGHLSDAIRSGDAVGLVTVGGKVYEVALDANGKLLPGVELNSILGNSSFQHLEIAKHVGGKYEIFASIKGDGTAILAPVVVATPIPVPTPAPTPIPVPSTSWVDKLRYFVWPLGANKYHETTKWEKEPRIKVPPMPEPTEPLGEWEPESDHEDDPVPPVDSPTPEPIPPTPPSSPESPTDSSDDIDAGEHEKDLRAKLDELFGRRRDFHNRSGKDGPHETRSKDVFQLDEKINWLQEELKALWAKDIPTWDDYVKKHTVGPIPKISHKSEVENTDGKSDKIIDASAKEDVNEIYSKRMEKLIAWWHVMKNNLWVPQIGFIQLGGRRDRPYIIMKTKDGVAVPFYRSSQGTSGKERGKWFPFFGVSSFWWIIKWSVQNMNTDYASPEIEQLSKLVNETLDYPHSIDIDGMRKSHPLDRFHAKTSQD